MSTLDLVRLAYEPEADDARWRERLARAIEREFDVGLGAMVWWHDLGAPGDLLTQLRGAASGAPAGFVDLAVATAEQGLDLMAAYMSRPVVSGFDVAGSLVGEFTARAGLHARGVRDFFGVNVTVEGGRGLSLAAGRGTLKRTTPRERVRLMRLRAHLASAVRLRLHHQARLVDAADAVLSPNGKLEHAATGSVERAGSALRAAAMAFERARLARGDHAQESALALWRALVRGEWSLVDAHERDGRRYLIALPNAPVTEGSARRATLDEQVLLLTAQGLSQTQIAYDLGISAAMVTRVKRRALEATGARSAAEVREVVGEGDRE